jgi:CTP:molybdopterin cytidylyltransferase MocA
MRDNGLMNTASQPEPTVEDQVAADALADVDPADAPDIADGIAASLQRELDTTGADDDGPTESNS